MTLQPLPLLESLRGKVKIGGRVIAFILVAVLIFLRRGRTQRVLRSKRQPPIADPSSEDAPTVAGTMIDMLDR